MKAGEKIQKLRRDKGWSQEDLASKLNVSRQTIYKWEASLANPDYENLKIIVKLFDVTFDYLLDDTKDVDEKKEEKTVVEETSIPNESSKEVIGKCEQCGKEIYQGESLIPYIQSRRVGRHTRTKNIKVCSSCYNTNEKTKDDYKKYKSQMAEKQMNKRRICSYVFGGLFLIAGIVLAILQVANQNPNWEMFGIYMASGVLLCTLVSCLILKNNFVADVFWEVMELACVRFPGIIFSLDIESIALALLLKALFAILGVLIAIGCFVLALSISGLVSFFVYPFALIKSYKHPEDVDI